MNRNIHRPPHIYLDNTIYFVTLSTLNKIRYFNTDPKKQLFENLLMKGAEKYLSELYAWTILDNHTHLLIKTLLSKLMPKFFNFVEGKSSIELNKIENQLGRKIWYQYLDRCIRNEADFYRHLNYIHHNCIKHKCSTAMENYKWSSYHKYQEKYGKDWILSCFGKYPVIDFTPQDKDDF